jgi:23S rRNA (guanosine2251-2'-O)-methyltransferase
MLKIILIVHNIRSCHNVGSLLRTAEGLGVERVYLTGYTPYPALPNDDRLPYLAQKINNQIHKTALGAEQFIGWQHSGQIEPILAQLKSSGFKIVGLEQHRNSVKLPKYRASTKTALIVGREVEGLENEILLACDTVIEIPMLGHKESFNVAAATAIALYHLRFNQP